MPKMDYTEKILKEFLYKSNSLNLEKWIENVQFEFNNNKKEINVYFPHKFIFKLFCDKIKNKFEYYIFSNSPDITINYKAQKKNFNKESKIHEKYQYDSKFQLDNFFYNQKNKLAVITCEELIKDKFENFNNFIIYGYPGTGKTHLLKSILNKYLLKNPNHKILYTKPQTLFSISKKRKKDYPIQNFLQYFDIICIDDFHTILNYHEILSDISHFINYCPDNSQKAFLGCNKLSELFQKVDQKLRSRMESGIHIHLNPPDMDVKMRYITYFCQQRALLLSDEQIMHIARQFDDFKALQKVLSRMAASAGGGGSSFCADSLLQREIRSVATSGLTSQMVISELSDYFQIPSRDILSGTKRRDAVRARQIGMTICRQMLEMSYSRIGKAFGGRDHSTVMYSVNKLLDSLEKDQNLQALFQSVKLRCEQLRS